MEFGFGSYEGKTERDFDFPLDNVKLPSGKKNIYPKIYVGLTKWNDKKWIGSLYPNGTKDAQFLEHYAKHFNSVELNATHYKIYKPEEISKWAAKADGADFKFCPKFVNSISHFSGFSNTEYLTSSFLEGVMAFGEKLGPIFLQLSDKFSTQNKSKVFSYLKSLPSNLTFFLELRHKDWFSDNSIKQEWYDSLSSMKVGAVITDAIERRDIVHMQLTTHIAFIRFVCHGNHPLDKYRVEQWKKKLADWFEKGLTECYFFIHAHDDDSLIGFAEYVQGELSSLLVK